jgi:glycosyltransferase involved in cell wall biosynthesis
MSADRQERPPASSISVVIPVHDELGAIGNVFAETMAVLGALEARTGRTSEIIIVDDGSRDGTAELLRSLDGAVVVTLGRNFGQTSALDAGIRVAGGDVIVTMDGDGQNDPADIPALVAKLDEGWDVVSGWRRERRDPLGKRIASRLARIVRRWLIDDGIHDSGCTLKAYRAECFDGLELYGELHRFIPGMLVWQGWRVTEMPVNHRPRMTGRTNYGWRRGVKGLLDMLAVWFWRKYAQRPQHLFGGLGLLFLLGGGGLLGLLAVLRIAGTVQLADSVLPLAGFFLLLTGVQLLAFGLVSDVLFRTHHRVQQSPPYTVRDIRRPGGIA